MIIKKSYKNSSLSIVQQCKEGQHVCGDAYFTAETEEYLILAIADGLGSGRQAKEAADQAVQCFGQHHHLDVKELMILCNKGLQYTRGAVAGILKLDFTTSIMTYAGVGNVQFLLCPAEHKTIRPISKPGYLNGRPVQVLQHQFAYQRGTPFLMFSDGLDVKQTLTANIKVSNDNDPHLLEAQLVEQLSGAKDDLTFILGKAHY